MDIFPVLRYIPKWFPGGSFKRKAEHWSSLANDIYEIPYAAAQKAIKDNTATPSFISVSMDEENDGTGLDHPTKEILVKSMAATMYSSGVDANLCVMGTFLHKMLAHPEVQKKTTCRNRRGPQATTPSRFYRPSIHGLRYSSRSRDSPNGTSGADSFPSLH